ncbi:hypothetical protein N3K66_003442 [Trichothecium roseum]|uniref:Uncharacterized protein n=1 Tax=Trichothecium roseum TaxID=47278 RepID=A0ACC0V6S8_9HYPO|nr:hypothetical protein N3K66_003442 [Trichothecium roseum]
MSQGNKTYRGNCHCGAFVYEAECPEIKEVTSCNCSICVRKGYLWVFPGKDNFRFVKGDADGLTGYEFGQKMINHKFCPTCGTPLLGIGSDKLPPSMAIALNAHAIQGMDTWSLTKKQYDGKSGLPGDFTLGEHKGALPVEKEGCKLYKGSCHCGAVTVAVTSPPLDETYKDRIVECNCSICERNGYVWCYPPPESVVLSGAEENIGRYQFNWHILEKTFCKICGVPMTNKAVNMTKEQEEALPEQAVPWRALTLKSHAVNVRVFEGVDLDKLSPQRLDFKDKGPSYAAP